MSKEQNNSTVNFLIVDDEPLIRQSVSSMLNCYFKKTHFHILEAGDGREALSIIAAEPVDMMLIDMKMPKMSGLELMQILYDQHNNAHKIVLSGFDDYSLVRTAMKLGATDYLLKPIVKEDFVSIVTNNLKDILYSENYRRSHPDRITLDENDLYKSQYILSQLLSESPVTNEIITSSDKCVMLMIDYHSKNQDNIFENENMFAQCREYFSNHSGEYDNLYMGDYDNKWIIIITNATEEIYATIQPFLASFTNKEIKACCSHLFLRDGIANAYDECSERIDHFFFNMIKSHAINEESYPYEKHITSMETAACAFQYAKFKESLHDLCLLINSQYREISVSQVKELFSTFIYNLMQMKSSYIKIIGKYKFTEKDIMQHIENAFSLSTLENDLCTILKEYMDECAHPSTVNETDYISQAKDYINNHYAEDITLNNISEHLNIHPNYFSSIFKKKTGLTFIEYLRNRRIEIACDLLRTTRKKQYEISEEVGYHDPFQFTRAFKKVTGMTPSKYRSDQNSNK